MLDHTRCWERLQRVWRYCSGSLALHTLVQVAKCNRCRNWREEMQTKSHPISPRCNWKLCSFYFIHSYCLLILFASFVIVCGYIVFLDSTGILKFKYLPVKVTFDFGFHVLSIFWCFFMYILLVYIVCIRRKVKLLEIIGESMVLRGNP